jgi:hypothetical protein
MASLKGGDDKWQKHMFILKPVMHKSFQLLAKKVSLGSCACLLPVRMIFLSSSSAGSTDSLRASREKAEGL